jgi:hypothetical protein
MYATDIADLQFSTQSAPLRENHAEASFNFSLKLTALILHLIEEHSLSYQIVASPSSYCLPCLKIHNTKQGHKVHMIVQLLFLPPLTVLLDDRIVRLSKLRNTHTSHNSVASFSPANTNGVPP